MLSSSDMKTLSFCYLAILIAALPNSEAQNQGMSRSAANGSKFSTTTSKVVFGSKGPKTVSGFAENKITNSLSDSKILSSNFQSDCKCHNRQKLAFAQKQDTERSSIDSTKNWNSDRLNPKDKVSPTVLRNAPFVYRGPVFIVQETEDVSEPYIAQVVEGGIEMVQPVNLKSFRKPLAATTVNDSTPEIQDDPEYFAVLVTPETVAQAQISRSTTITIPLPVLLLSVSSRIPWVMVLKRHNHFDYFRNLTPMHVPLPVRRRSRSQKLPNARLFTESRNYDLVYTEDDQNMMNGICASIIQELVFLNSVMQSQSNETEPDGLEPLEQASEKETSTSSKESEGLGDAKPTENLSLEKFLQVMSSMVNNNTQTTSESSLKKQKILQ